MAEPASSQALRRQGHNNYSDLQHEDLSLSQGPATADRDPYRAVTNESSPEISQTDQPSASSPSGARGYGGQDGMDDTPSSSMQESPESSKPQGLISEPRGDSPESHQNVNPHAQQLQNHLNQMNENFTVNLQPTQPVDANTASGQEGDEGASPSRSQPAESESLSPLRDSEL